MDVRKWQTLLKKAGFDVGDIDGRLGPKTKAATITFKKTVFKNPKDWNYQVGLKTLVAMRLFLLRKNKPKPVRPVINITRVDRPIDTIIIHYTDSADVSASTIDAWHKARGWNGIGYHFVIRKNGAIEKGRNLALIGAHAEGHNTGSIGIVLTGSNAVSWYPANVQINTLKRLIRDIEGVYKIKRMLFHRDVGSTDCPGRLTKQQVII